MKITQIVALVSATAFILTVVYTYGFSNAVDVNLLKYFSVNDYIKFSVSWLPNTIFLAGLGYSFMKLWEIGFIIAWKNKNTQSSDMSTFTKFILKHENRIASLTCMGISSIIVIANLSLNASKSALYGSYNLLGICFWAVFWRNILIPMYTKEWTIRQRNALLLVPIIIISAYFYGAVKGQSELESVDKHPTSQLEMTNKEPISGRVLLALTQYIVFIEQKTKTVDIIPVGQVKTIISIPKNKSKEKKNVKQLEEAKKERKETIK